MLGDVCVCVRMCGVGGDLGFKVILLESVVKAWWIHTDGQAQMNRDDCGPVEILSQKLCKRYMDVHAIPL